MVQITGQATGTVLLSLKGSMPNNSCFVVSKNPTVTAYGSATTVIALYTGASCSTVPNAQRIRSTVTLKAANTTSLFPRLALASLLGFFLIGIGKRRKSWIGWTGCIWTGCILLGAVSLAIGCGTPSKPTLDATAGSYSLTVTGTDSATSTNVATTTFTLTVQ